jgi:uncharacterized protein YbaP (TraB family)
VSTIPVVYTPETVVPTEKALLWKISEQGNKKPSYLFGTIHLIPKDKFSLKQQVTEAVIHSDRVYFEIDMKDMTNLSKQMGMITKAFMSGGTTLKDIMSPEDYTLVRSRITGLGLPVAIVERLKPMFLSTLFSLGEEAPGLNETSMTSVEMEIYALAKKQGKPTAGLETAEYQMALFDSIPYQEQSKLLVEAIKQQGESKTLLDDMLKLYFDQDIQGMQSLVVSDQNDSGRYEPILLLNRNRNWVKFIKKAGHAESRFYAVGAGHLGGPFGVIALLRKEGFRVEAITD